VSSWGISWGDSWGDSWGTVSTDPGALRGHAYGTSTASGTLSIADTHPVPVVFYGGRYRKTKKQIEDQRRALGILPEVVAKVTNKIAAKVIRKATETRQPDVVEWAQHDDQRELYERQFRLELARQKQAWDNAYQNILIMAIEEHLQREEEAVLMLLLEL
jgi:hypothetical protein